MEYAALVDVYRCLGATDSTLGKTAILAEAFADADPETLPLLVRLVRGTAFPNWRSAELGVSSNLTVEAIAKATGVADDRIEAAWRDTGDLGDAAAIAAGEATQRTLVSRELTVERVHDTLRELAGYEGAGSEGRRIDAVARLLSDADPEAARYVVRTVLGHLRVGVGEGTVRDAIAAAFLDGTYDAAAGEVDVDGDAVDAVERAFQVTNDFAVVTETAREEGRAGLDALDVELFRPIAVMLARKADGLADAVADVAPGHADVHAEVKYDGIRIQVHVDDEVRLFTRRLEDVTEQFPDVVDAVRAGVTADRCILEGELVGVDPETGDPVAFQRLSRRVKRKYDVAELAAEVPARTYLFDAVHVDGETLLDEPLRTRLDRLAGVVDPVSGQIERAAGPPPGALGDADHPVAAARERYQAALEAGHEGLMVKNLAATYQPGRRVGRMLKVKPTMEPLDLVVTRAAWSEGRRSENLGRLFLACYDPAADAVREVGRLSTGYSDETLAELTADLEPLIRETEGREVDVEPEIVLAVEYEEIQESPTYDSGYALRFPRFLRRRPDLDPTDADTIDRVADLYGSQ